MTSSNRSEKETLPLEGFTESRINSGIVEFLSSEDLVRLNALLPWMCFTADEKGRRFGNAAWKGKRNRPQNIPDKRIVEFDRRFELHDKSVLEVGCFEGIHTIALCQRAKKVYAIDSRVENVVKTVVRTNLFGHQPVVTVCDLEQADDISRLPKVDFVHHVGVLYHLKSPIEHLLGLKEYVKEGILLDTHYASEEMLNAEYELNGKKYQYYAYREKGRDEVFSGMYDHAKWLTLKDIKDILAGIGFGEIDIYKDEVQRNGPRVTLYARRTENQS